MVSERFTPSSFSPAPDSGAASPGATAAPSSQAVHDGPAVARRPPRSPAPAHWPLRYQVPALAGRAPADPQPPAVRPAADGPAGRSPGRMAGLPAGRGHFWPFHGRSPPSRLPSRGGRHFKEGETAPEVMSPAQENLASSALLREQGRATAGAGEALTGHRVPDRKSTRLNS